MATNKRKESAALFELIGKSTLKIPKNAGALKIPGWWATKNNPLPASATLPPTSTEDRAHVPAPILVAPLAGGTAVGTPPSIRPPATPAPTPTAAPVAPSRPRSFVPNTVDPRAGTPPLRRLSPPSRLPLWMLVLGALFCLGLIVAAIYVVDAVRRSSTATPHPITPPPSPGLVITPPPHATGPANVVQPPLPFPPQNTHPGRVVPGNQVQRRPDFYYLVISTARTQDVATVNANFIAEHGTDDVVVARSGAFFAVVSVEGFPKRDLPEADALVKRIRAIGLQHPDAKRLHKGVYDDAYYDRIAAPK